MSTLSNLISGGGGGLTATELKKQFSYLITGSSTFSFPYSGTVDIYAIGGGGVGGLGFAANVPSTNNMTAVATGGGAGGTAIKQDVSVTAGQTIVISAGAAATLNSNTPWSNSNNVSNSAGSTTVNSNDITVALTANGGGNGERSNTFGTTTATENRSGGTGGTASGGDVNYTGGRGGNFTFTAGHNFNTYCGYVATGGGAVGLNTNGKTGGDITLAPSSGNANNTNAPVRLSSGGGGIGENGGSVNRNDINANFSSSAQGVASGGGGSLAIGSSDATDSDADTILETPQIKATDYSDSLDVANTPLTQQIGTQTSNSGYGYGVSTVTMDDVGGSLLGGVGSAAVTNQPQSNNATGMGSMGGSGFGGGGGRVIIPFDGSFNSKGYAGAGNSFFGGGAGGTSAIMDNGAFTLNTNYFAGSGCCLVIYKTIT